jgi:hypothetical protein
MSTSFIVYIATPITQEDLGELVAEFGGILSNPQEGTYRLGGKSQNLRGSLLIDMYPSIFRELEDEPERITLLTSKLGTLPQKAFSIQILGKEFVAAKEAFELARLFCIAAAQRWNAIIDCLGPMPDPTIYTLSDKDFSCYTPLLR